MPQGQFLLKLGLEARCDRLARDATPEQREAIGSGAARLALRVLVISAVLSLALVFLSWLPPDSLPPALLTVMPLPVRSATVTEAAVPAIQSSAAATL